ncbi:hypothetical protein NXS19_003865 [Fusarium pseudograminearum]|nr:hypothetical protein NXS19_003865 [Fusarium pseudograminearum]
MYTAFGLGHCLEDRTSMRRVTTGESPARVQGSQPGSRDSHTLHYIGCATKKGSVLVFVSSCTLAEYHTTFGIDGPDDISRMAMGRIHQTCGKSRKTPSKYHVNLKW